MKVVLDTNVLIAAFLTAGTSRKVLELSIQTGNVHLSPYILEELKKNLSSEKFDLPPKFVDAFLNYVKAHAVISKSEPQHLPAPSFPDPADIPILEFCLAIHADFLVTGDGELLRLKRIGQTEIIPPALYWTSSQNEG